MKVCYIFGIDYKDRGDKTLFSIMLFNVTVFVPQFRKYLKANLVLERMILYFLIFDNNKIIPY